MNLKRLTAMEIPSIHPENPEGDDNLEFDQTLGKMRWTWEASEELKFELQFDFEGLDIYIYNFEEDVWDMVDTEPWYVRDKTADFVNQIVAAVEKAGSLEDADYVLHNPPHVPSATA